MVTVQEMQSFKTSPSSRRAWVEIRCRPWRTRLYKVALLAEGVGRNRITRRWTPQWKPSPSSRRAWVEISQISAPRRNTQVALLAEGVGRNHLLLLARTSTWVALLAEGVGRNCPISRAAFWVCWSPSSRRAWVEIIDSDALTNSSRRRPPRGGRG